MVFGDERIADCEWRSSVVTVVFSASPPASRFGSDRWMEAMVLWRLRREIPPYLRLCERRERMRGTR
jgi:hypothetical protein